MKDAIKTVKLKSILKRDNFFIISGKNSFSKSKFNEKFNLKSTNNIFLKKKNYPNVEELKKILNKVNIHKPKFIVAIGGGSVLDYAKLVSCLYNLKKINYLKLTELKFKKKIKVIAIPTTAGSGAEVTPNCVLYKNKKKLSLHGKDLKPDYFYLNQSLLKGLSKYYKASSSYDALSQAIESLIAKKSNLKSRNFSKKSIQIILKNIKKYLKEGDSKSTTQMLNAANLSGRAIAITETTAPHALSYGFTAFYNVPHGYAVILTLLIILKFNYQKVLENKKKYKSSFDKYNILFKTFKVKNISQLINKIKSIISIYKYVFKYRKNFSVQKILFGINQRRLKNNPVEISKKDLKLILKKVQKNSI
jgi:alcohol dehydrogenase class IV